MTEPFDEYGERLRRALHAEADAVTPSPEGLEQIRSKINKRRERRLGLWFAAPWLRPLAAVAAAIFFSVIAVSATPALKNFVQTGHFSADSQSGSGQTSTTIGHSQGQWPPGGGLSPVPSVSRPNTVRPSSTGKHVVNAPCPAGEGTVTPTGSATPAARSGGSDQPAKVTCQPRVGTSSASSTDGPTTSPSSSPTQPSTSEEPPTSASQPAANASP